MTSLPEQDITFDKYQRYGAYHWKEYEEQTIYGKHAERIKNWGITLDIGCGDGLITSLIGAEGIDDNETAIELAQEKGVKVKLRSAYDLSGYANNSFDNVVMADVIEHLEFPEKVLPEIRRILKIGGALYITTPPAKENGLHDPKYHHREYTPTELIKLLNDNFFSLQGKIEEDFVRMYAKFIK
jgi:SAM-dependent methyltransferase